MPEHTASWRAVAELATSQVERIDALRRMVQVAPEDAAMRTQFRQALLARAVMIARTDPVEARARFQEVAALHPGDTRVWQALCNLAETRDERAKYLRELLRIAPDHPQARGTLRRLLVETAREFQAAGSLPQSRARWHEAIEVAGSDVELWLGFAEACDDPVEAMRAVQAAQELDSHDPRVLEALATLNGQQIDPSALPEPGDAFARFDNTAGSPDGDVLNEVVDDSLLDALAQLPDAPAAAPIVASVEQPAELTEEPAVVEQRIVVLEDASDADEHDAPAIVASEIVLDIDSVDSLSDAPQPVDAAPLAPTPVASSTAPDPATVLVVDDSPTIRKILGLTLERAGYTVVTAANGQSALTSLQDLVPGVVLLDIAMPDLDGYEVCKRIKQDPRTSAVPVIMLSGKGAFFDKVKGHLAGATEYLTKPFETATVLNIVSSHCAPAAVEAHHG